MSPKRHLVYRCCPSQQHKACGWRTEQGFQLVTSRNGPWAQGCITPQEKSQVTSSPTPEAAAVAVKLLGLRAGGVSVSMRAYPELAAAPLLHQAHLPAVLRETHVTTTSSTTVRVMMTQLWATTMDNIQGGPTRTLVLLASLTRVRSDCYFKTRADIMLPAVWRTTV